MNSKSRSKMIVILIILVILLVVVGFLGGSIFETNTAGHIQVKQAAVTGNLSCQMEPGMYFQNFGDIHDYLEAETFYFTADLETGESKDQSLPTRFNDGTKAMVSGSVRVLLPATCDDLVHLHRKFKGMKGVMQKLVLPAIRKTLFNTGPHMSAAESFAEKRGEFAALAEDQLINGIFMVDKQEADSVDPITGEPKKVWIIKKKPCAPDDGMHCIGGFKRDPSAFKQFGVQVTNFVIDEIFYPDNVLSQIEQQRKAKMDIITQQAEAKLAEARASKAKAEAQAQVEETRAKEEVEKTVKIVKAEADKEQAVLKAEAEKAKAIVEATKKKEVAELAKQEAIIEAEKKKAVAALDLEAADMEKQANILRGEGEAKKKKLIMEADGALEKKLDAWLKAQQAWADAMSKAQPGALVPTIIMGNDDDNGGDTSKASNFMDLLMIKTAKDLAVDLKPGAPPAH